MGQVQMQQMPQQMPQQMQPQWNCGMTVCAVQDRNSAACQLVVMAFLAANRQDVRQFQERVQVPEMASAPFKARRARDKPLPLPDKRIAGSDAVREQRLLPAAGRSKSQCQQRDSGTVLKQDELDLAPNQGFSFQRATAAASEYYGVFAVLSADSMTVWPLHLQGAMSEGAGRRKSHACHSFVPASFE